MEILSNQITGIIAPKGAGKTYEACGLVRELPRVTVFDVAQEEQYGLVCEEVIFGNPQELARQLALPEFKVSYRTVYIEPGFEHFTRLCYLQGNCTMILEEADQLCSPYGIPETFKVAINLGRHRQLSIVYITRSFSGVHGDLKRNTNRFIFWKIIEPNDLAGIADRCGEETAERVAGLRKLQTNGQQVTPGEKLIWDDTGEIYAPDNYSNGEERAERNSVPDLHGPEPDSGGSENGAVE